MATSSSLWRRWSFGGLARQARAIWDQCVMSGHNVGCGNEAIAVLRVVCEGVQFVQDNLRLGYSGAKLLGWLVGHECEAVQYVNNVGPWG
jgi:hypothetical protein